MVTKYFVEFGRTVEGCEIMEGFTFTTDEKKAREFYAHEVKMAGGFITWVRLVKSDEVLESWREPEDERVYPEMLSGDEYYEE